MKTLRLIRLYRDTHTEGELWSNSHFLCYCLELPWISNKRNVSCIPTGQYNFIPWKRHGKPAFRVEYVQGRSGILIHIGNLISHTKGCILPGMERNEDGSMTGGTSGPAMSKLAELYPVGGMLEID